MEERIYRVGGRDTRLEQNRSRQVFGTLQARAEGFHHITVPLNALEDSQLLLPRTLGAAARTQAEINLLSRALKAEEIDLFQAPVDSLNWELPAQLTIAAIIKRQDARDVLVIRKDQSFSTLKAGSRIYSNGLRREVQLEQLRSDLSIEATDLSLDDQLEAIETGEVSGVVASAADLVAIGMESYRANLSFRPFSLTAMVPAAGQGLIAIVCRKEDQQLCDLLKTHMDDAYSRLVYETEGQCARALGLHKEDAKQYYAALHIRHESDGLYLLALSSRGHSHGANLIRQRLNRSGETLADPTLIEAAIQSMVGSCTFIGIDAYDPEGISLKADRVIREADRLIYNRRLRHVLSLYNLPDTVTTIEIADGENAGERLPHLLRSGYNCVRLLEGDPFLFGEAPLEVATLREEHMAVDLIPGSSTLLTWPVFSGIPLVYRDMADHIHIYDGHRFPLQSQDSLSRELTALDPQSSLLFYRAATRLPDIVASLKDAQFDLTTPAALITHGSGLEQVVIESSLDLLPALAVAENALDPAILVVGAVTKLREKLKWWPPLGPMNRMYFMLVSTERVMQRSVTLQKPIRSLGGTVYTWQLAREERRSYLDDQIAAELVAALERKQASRRFERNELWLAIDGVGAADALGRCLRQIKLDHRLLAPVNIAASDAATAIALDQIGFEADYVSATNDVDDMAAHLASILNPSDFVLGISSETGHRVLSLVLQLAEIPCTNLLYAEYLRERPNSGVFLDQLAEVDNIIFADDVAVREFSTLVGDLGLDQAELAQSGMLFFAASPEAERTAIARGIPLAEIPAAYNTESILDLLKSKAVVRENEEA